jgi:hypothetical protein
LSIAIRHPQAENYGHITTNYLREKTLMKKLITICLAVTVLLALSAVPAFATLMPGEPLGLDPFDIDLYEPEPDPNPEFSITLLPELVVSGFVVLIEPEDPAIWSDIVEFRTTQSTGPSGEDQSWADFYSDIEGQPFDPILVKRATAGYSGVPTQYLVEDHYPTVYVAGTLPYANIYRIWSIPEPATIAILGLGALSLLRRRK